MEARTDVERNKARGLRGVPGGYERSFVGRQDEVEALVEAGQAGGLVALWGPPGVGKTRLAIEVADRVMACGDFEAGVFCALNEASGLEDVAARLARLLDFQLRSFSVEQAVHSLQRWFASRSLVVVLDNAEGVLEVTVELAARLAEASPDSTIIVTTRQAPRLDAAHVAQVAPLSIDDGVSLLRARGGGLGDADEATLAAIVEHLDALPLSVELAAARLPVFSCAQLLERLDRQLQTLQDYDEQSQRWQATLERALDDSWSLLDTDERQALGQCSVFADDFDLDAAEHVLALPGGRPVDQVLQSLINKALVFSLRRSGALGTRFRLYEVVKQYAARKLDAHDRQSTMRRLVEWFGERARQHEEGFYSPEVVAHVEAMQAEFANMRLALSGAEVDQARAIGRLVRSMWTFVHVAASFRDLRPIFEQKLSMLEAADEDLAALEARAELHRGMAQLETYRSRDHEAIGHGRRAAALAKEHHFDRIYADAKAFLAFASGHFQNDEHTEQHLQAVEAFLQGHQMYRIEGKVKNIRGGFWLRRGQPEKTRECLRQALALQKRVGNRREVCRLLANLACVACATGRFGQALDYAQKGLDEWQQMGDPYAAVMSRVAVGQCSSGAGARRRGRRRMLAGGGRVRPACR